MSSRVDGGCDHLGLKSIRNPDHLYAKLAETNAEKKLAGRTPHVDPVKDWVAQVQTLPKLLEY